MFVSQQANLVASKYVTAIVRSVGKRTETACYNLLAEQVPAENIVIINEVPFSAAVAKTFQVGIERGLPWTLCIDADVLIRDGAVNDLLTVAARADKNIFEIQTNILCKFFGGARQAGNHLYRTSLLNKAFDCIPQQEVIRPETHTIRQMAKRGFPWLEVRELTIGLHDYEQYYVDIYRKAFIQAHKHSHYQPMLFEPLWGRLCNEDFDYQVALWGLDAGKTFKGEVRIDTRQFPEEIDRLLQVRGRQEKEELISTKFSGSVIARAIAGFQPPPEYRDYQNFQKLRRQSSQTLFRRWLRKIGQILPTRFDNSNVDRGIAKEEKIF